MNKWHLYNLCMMIAERHVSWVPRDEKIKKELGDAISVELVWGTMNAPG